MGRLPAPPPALKPLQMFLKTADEFDRREQSIAFYCRSYAAKLGIEKYRTAETTPFLMQLLDVIEADKKALGDSEAVKSDIVGQSKLYDTAIKLFAVADTKDRAGESTKEVAQTFYTAMVLFETQRYFGDLEDETQEKLKYAKWKAAYIIKCLREGVVPVPGPVDAEGNPLPDEPDASGAAMAAAMAATAFPSAPSAAADPYHQQFQQPPSQQQHQQPLYPPPPQQQQQQWPQAPPPQQPQHQPPPPQAQARPFQPPAPTHFTPPLPPPQQQQQQQQQPLPQWSQAPPPPAKPAAPIAFAGQSFTPKAHVSIADNEQASKFSKFVISALQYNDTATAVDNLLKALRLLTN